jgi:hypothetical protein
MPHGFYEFISQIVPGFILCALLAASPVVPVKQMIDIPGTGAGVLIATWLAVSWVFGLLLVTLGKLLLTPLADGVFGNPYSYLLGGGQDGWFSRERPPKLLIRTLLKKPFRSGFKDDIINTLTKVLPAKEHIDGLAIRYAETIHPWAAHFVKSRAMYLMARSLTLVFLVGAIVFYEDLRILFSLLAVAILFFITYVYRRTWRARTIYESLYLWFCGVKESAHLEVEQTE